MSGGAVLYTDAFLEHGSVEHVERPERARVIRAALARSPLEHAVEHIAPRPATLTELERVHPAVYLARLDAFCRDGGGWIDADTVLSPRSANVAHLAAGAANQAVEAVLSGERRWAFSICRPPGHHATPTTAMGFCLVNNAAVAARHAQSLGARRVLIIDWDVHHGNGTQDAFYDDGTVFYFSVHQSPLYPGSGRTDERGVSVGRGATMNVPLRAGRSDDDYIHVFQRALRPAARAFSPDLVIVSAGFDAHSRDPLGQMCISTDGFGKLASITRDIAEETPAKGRLVGLLEGGYDLQALADSAMAVMGTWDAPRTLGDEATTVDPATIDAGTREAVERASQHC